MSNPNYNKVKNYLIANRKYAKQVICLNYPFTLDELKTYEAYLDWDAISSNGQIKWDSKILSHFQNKLNWGAVSTNNAAFKNLELIDEFIDQIHWYCPDQSFFSTNNQQPIMLHNDEFRTFIKLTNKAD